MPFPPPHPPPMPMEPLVDQNNNCIAERCISEYVQELNHEGLASFYSYYMSALLFYLLTVAEAVTFIDKDESPRWYASAISALALVLMFELLVIASNYSGIDADKVMECASLEYSNIYGPTFNSMMNFSFVLREGATAFFLLCYTMSFFQPACLEDCATDLCDRTSVHPTGGESLAEQDGQKSKAGKSDQVKVEKV